MAQTAQWVLEKAYLLATRKATAPTSGNKYEALLELIDLKQKEWAQEPGVEWNSLFELVDLGTISATDTFDLDDTIQYISKRPGDFALATNDTNTVEYTVVHPGQLYANRYDNAIAQIGRTVKFPTAFTSTSGVFGYTLKVPAYIYPDDITTLTQEVQVDDPLWLAYMVAYEFTRNDVTKVGVRGELLDFATNLMDKMKEANGTTYDVVATPYSVWGEDY